MKSIVPQSVLAWAKSAELLRFALVVAVFPLTAIATAEIGTDMLVTTEWLAAHLNDSDLVVLCIAEDEHFYSLGHIPGARLIHLSHLVTPRDGIPNELPSADQLQRLFERVGLSERSRVVLYGERSGMLAARAYFTLDYAGLAERAALLDGGIEKWRAEGRPESIETSSVTPTSLRLRVHPEIVADLSSMTEHSQEPSRSQTALIDARSPAEYAGATASEAVSKLGHIPHAKNLYWRDAIQGGDIPQLLPVDDLQQLFRAAGAAPGSEVVTYCRTGMQSSFDYYLAKYLGFKARMYDRSFYEWSRNSLPVERRTAH